MFDNLKYTQDLARLQWIWYTGPMIFLIIFDFIMVAIFWSGLVAKSNRSASFSKKSSAPKNQPTTGATSTKDVTSSINQSLLRGRQNASQSHQLKKLSGADKINQKSQKMIIDAVLRIIWYPMIPLITALPFSILLALKSHLSAKEFRAIWTMIVLANLQGLGNALTFYFDPATILAKETFRKYLCDHQVLKYHPIVQGSISKTPRPMPRAEYIIYSLFKILVARSRDFKLTKEKKVLNTQSVRTEKAIIKCSELKEDDLKGTITQQSETLAVSTLAVTTVPGDDEIGNEESQLEALPIEIKEDDKDEEELPDYAELIKDF
jgi:hypothetical protein